MKVLFVDDEQSVLDGLRHTLFRHRKKWDIEYATSGVEALALCAERSFDVVVSDMRMPRMNGAELLAEIQKGCPDAMRLILSGQADPSALQKAIPVAHQILSKPCPPELLISTLERVERTVNFLRESRISFPIGDLCNLPGRPKTFEKLNNLLEQDTLDVDVVATVIKEDIVLSTRVLSLINSPYFGMHEPVDSIHKAVTLLGPTLLRILVVSMEFGPDAHAHPDLRALERHSFDVARLMRAACPTTASASTWFACGLLHDIGKLVLGRHFADYDVQMTLEEEQATYGVTHAQLGAHLLSSWGLPVMFIEATAFHHGCDPMINCECPSLLALIALEQLMEVHHCAPTTTEFATLVEKTILNKIDKQSCPNAA